MLLTFKVSASTRREVDVGVRPLRPVRGSTARKTRAHHDRFFVTLPVTLSVPAPRISAGSKGDPCDRSEV